MAFARRAYDTGLLDLLESAGRNVERSSQLLRDVLREHPDGRELTQALRDCEHEGDRLTHDIIHLLRGGEAVRAPFDAADGHALATALDDIVDYAEQAGDWLGLYAVEAPMEQALGLADVLVAASAQVSAALAALRDGSGLQPILMEINRLENEGDRLHRDAVASLFANGIDPMVVIRWKDIFESLEAAVDACDTVAHILEGIALKQRY